MRLKEADLDQLIAVQDRLPAPPLTRPVLGLDPGTRFCGVAVVAPGDELLHHTVLSMRGTNIQGRILACKAALAVIVHHWQPMAIGVERYVWEGRQVTNHESMNWLIGIMLDLGTLCTPFASVHLYTVSEWRRQLIGRSGRRCLRGAYGKEAAERVVNWRLGGGDWQRGLHDMDASGIALVCLDNLRMQERVVRS